MRLELARRHLADDRDQHRILAPRDRGDVHERVVFLEVHVAVRFPEAAFGLEPLGVEIAFDDDLGLRRDQEIDGLRLADADRRADEAPGDRELVEMLRQLVDRGKNDGRRGAEHQRDRHPLAARLVFEPVLVDALVELDLRVHAHACRAFDHRPVVADVLAAGVGVLGDEHRARRIGRVVEARGRDRDRQTVDALAGLVEGVALDDDLLAGRVVNQHGLDLLLLGAVPILLDVLDLAADADAVDFPVGSEDADGHRHVVAASGAVDDVLEQEALALVLRNAAAELPAHQRVHLRVLVDRALDAKQQTVLLQGGDVRVQV